MKNSVSREEVLQKIVNQILEIGDDNSTDTDRLNSIYDIAMSALSEIRKQKEECIC